MRTAWIKLLSRISVAIALAVLASAAPPASAQSIGTVAAARAAMTGIAPGEDARSLAVGSPLVAADRVVSDSSGGGQILFNDQTSLTIAPNSDVTLDAFVFDPERDAGDIAVTLSRGALRFIGARISKSRDAIIRTPTATLAIRGGIALVDLSGGVMTVIHIAGERTEIRLPNGEPLSLSREGAMAEVRPTGDGGFEIVYLGVATPQEIAAAYEAIQGDGPTMAFELLGVGRTGLGFDEAGGVFRGPVSTSGAEPQESGPTVILEQFETDRFQDLPPPPPPPLVDEEEG